jgi:membrane-bound serine protease (ClpP class)
MPDLATVIASIDPDIVYLAAVLGLWFSVTVVYVPGTVVLEKLAIAGLLIAGLLLTQMPTNWAAALVLSVGVLSFIIIPFLKTEIAPLAVGGLALQGLGALFLFGAPGESRGVSPLLIGMVLLTQFAYHTFVLMPMLRQIRARAAQPADSDALLVGMIGRVVKALDPLGTVHVNGELWTAEAAERDTIIEAGESVIVLARDGLQLTVEPAKRKREPLNGASVEPHMS